MANANAPMGLVPVRDTHGRPYNGAVNTYYVASDYGTALFVGDPVKVSSSGDANGVPGVERAAAGNAAPILGVIVGVRPDPDNLTLRYIPATTGGYVLVADDPSLLYEIQEDSLVSTLAVTDIGLNTNLIAGSGDTSTGLSGFQLDSSDADTTADDQLQIVGLSQKVDNEIGANANWLVKINVHQAAVGRTGT